jgi:hypothetical protein
MKWPPLSTKLIFPVSYSNLSHLISRTYFMKCRLSIVDCNCQPSTLNFSLAWPFGPFWLLRPPLSTQLAFLSTPFPYLWATAVERSLLSSAITIRGIILSSASCGLEPLEHTFADRLAPSCSRVYQTLWLYLHIVPESLADCFRMLW